MRPILTFLTDFGLADAYVAQMKATALAVCPEATLVDITHLIPPQNVLAGSIALECALRAFPAGTFHVAVVDPGVGTDRKLLVIEINGQTVLCPDNGLITWAHHLFPGATTRELTWRPDPAPSNTFHGRDILAPAAAMMAAETFDGSLLKPLQSPMLLDFAPAKNPAEAIVIYIDHYGNAITNVPAELLCPGAILKHVGPLKKTYGDVAPGEPVALIGSGGLLEIAVRNGSAASQLKLAVGSRLEIE